MTIEYEEHSQLFTCICLLHILVLTAHLFRQLPLSRAINHTPVRVTTYHQDPAMAKDA